MIIDEALDSIENLNEDIMFKVQERLDDLTKPIGSLGKLEFITKKIAGISNKIFPDINKRGIIIMCSDNGVYEEGVSSCPKEVTSIVTKNFTKGITAINVLAKQAKSELIIVDIGVDDDIDIKGILNKKIRKGTSNIAKESAMSRSEAIKAIEVGIQVVRDLKNKGYNLLGTGEMGIGNTTTSSAIIAVLSGGNSDEFVGKGSGLSKEAFENKKSIIRRAIEINKPDQKDPIDILAKVGGFDIAGLVGCYIGAAENRIPIVIDGIISGVAAALAVAIEPKIRNFIFASHKSAEPGSDFIREYLGIDPMLHLNMRVGEGTGAAMGFNIIESAILTYEDMGTFSDATIKKYIPQE